MKSSRHGFSNGVTRRPEVVRYMDAVVHLLNHQKIPHLVSERLRLELFVYPPDKRKRDLDNICKASLDVLQHAGIYGDDFHIQQLYVERREVRKFGEIEFVLSSI